MTAPIVTAPAWSVAAIARLRDAASCPVCGQSLRASRCRSCGADLTTSAATDLWSASQAAAEALSARELLRLRIPRSAPSPASIDATADAAPPAERSPTTAPATGAPRGNTSVQSVLAVAGASLFAVAAVVFTFFNPDLADHTVRSLVTLAVTVVFLVGARMLAARGLRSSSEAVGALGMVFVALDVYAVAGFAPAGVSAWVFTAMGTLLAGTVMATLAVRARIRAWVGASVVGLALVPAMLGAAGGPIAGMCGWVATMAAALALIILLRRAASTFGRALTAEAIVLTAVQVVAAAGALLQLSLLGGEGTLWAAAAVCAAFSLVARLSARTMAATLWSWAAGGAMAAGGGALALAIGESLGAAPAWFPVLLIAGPLCGFLLASLAVPPRSPALRAWSDAGALIVVGLASVPVLSMAALGSLQTLTGLLFGALMSDGGEQLGATIGVAVAALGFAVHAVVARRQHRASGWSAAVAAWLAAAAAAATTALPLSLLLARAPGMPPWPNVAVGILFAVLVPFALRRRATPAGLAVAAPLLLGAHVALLLAAAVSWSTTNLAVMASPVVIAALVPLALALPAAIRWMHVGVGYAYALVAIGTGLSLTGIGEIAVLSLTTTAGALVAIAATFVRAVRAPSWWAVLAVTSVPFLLGVLQVVRERSGWTALSTGLIFLLALTLVLTRRPGLVPVLRALCAGMLVPSAAVVVVCLGAQVLLVSASPFTLPVIAVIVALALPAATVGAATLERRGLPAADAALVRWAIELSALVTGALAVALALGREAAGLATAVEVLVILAVGAAAAAILTTRRLFWWVAAAAATGALWSVWRIVEIDVLEPYVLPPALGAAAVGIALLARGRNGRALASTGLAVAVAPTLAMLAVAGGLWRVAGLLAASAALWATARVIPPASGRATPLAALRAPALLLAILAAAAGPVQGTRFGWGADPLSPEIGSGILLFVVCLTVAAAGGVLAALAGVRLARIDPASRRSRSRWLLAPAVLYALGGTWTAIESDWATIWAMWALMLVALCAVVAIAWRLRRDHDSGHGGGDDDSTLPPVWFVFALAFVTAVVAWSPRELRVEWFSLPLGIALLTAGAVHLGRAGRLRATLDSWPRGWTGSWALLAPGTITIMSASIVATFTDPLTWRAILVIVMALIAILVGARARLAAPFLIGIVVLPIENVSAFAVQIGRGIESMPWWITLAVVGAVLLIIAVSYERRAGEAESLTARLRDLS